MKKFIMGFLTAALLFTAIPIGAAIEEYICYKADYKVMVTGTEYINEDLPILNYKGNTYAPFRSILEAAGLNVHWNTELKQAEVTIAPVPAPTREVETVSEVPLNKYGLPDFSKVPADEKPTIEDDGKNQYFTYEGVKYIRLGWDKYHPRMIPYGYYLWNPDIDENNMRKIVLTKTVEQDGESKSITVFDEIPYSPYDTSANYYIPYDYYQNTFVPELEWPK